MSRLTVLTAVGTLLTASGCASLGGKPPTVDLAPARQAVEEARAAGAPERATDRFNDAVAHLREAEGLLAQKGGGAGDRAERAEWLARLAGAEAACASTISALPSAAETKAEGAERERLEGRVRKANDDKRRAEERAAVLQRELELTETEIIRTKARLQGMETKAEASSALAEARILMKRLETRKGPAFGRVQDLVAKAEQQLGQNNYGASVFFARRAQDVAIRASDEK